MISVNSGQTQIASRASAEMVTLVKLVTFTDYTAGTVDETFYWSSVPIQYKWNGSTVNQFRGLLKSVSPVVRGFTHLPGASDLPTRDGMALVLDATKWADEYPWSRLIGTNLIGAKIEVASLLVDWGSPRPDTWQDQTGLGAVHTVRFRGEVTKVPEYSDEANDFSLICDSVEPVLPWKRALDSSEVSEKDLGKTYPVPVGAVKRMPLVQRTVGWVTTLVSDITAAFTGNVTVTDATGFPDSGSFAFWIGAERLTATKVDGFTINITARFVTIGNVTSIAAAHNSGAVMIEEIETANFVYAGIETLGLDALYARSPQSGELILITSGLYGVVQADDVVDSGTQLGVVSFTQELMGGVIQLLNNAAAITVQPILASSGKDTIQITFGSFGDVATVTSSIKCSTDNLLGVTQSSVVMDFDDTDKNAAVFWCNTGSVPTQTRSVFRFRVVWKIRIESNASVVTTAKYELLMLNHTQSTTFLTDIAAGPNNSQRTVATAWFTPNPAATLADLVNNSSGNPTSGNRALCYMDQTAGGTSSATQISVSADSYVEVELNPLPVTVTTNTETTGAQEIGFNLDLFADVRGAVTLASVISHDEMDEKAGWTPTGCTLTDLADGFQIDSDNTLIDRTVVKTITSLDASAHRFSFEYNVPQATWDIMSDTAEAVRISFTSSGGNFVSWRFPKSCFHPDAWNTFSFDSNGSGTQIVDSSGSLNHAAVTQINFAWRAKVSGDGGQFSIRNMTTTPRTYHTHPVDVAEWLIEENVGISSGADSSTFATAKTNLPSVVAGADLRTAGSNFAEVLARIGFESRTNFVLSEASGQAVYKAFNALSSYAFPASGRTLTEFNSLATRTKELDEQPNEFVGLYDFRNQFEQSDVQGYAALLQANATTNDISGDGVPTSTITDAQDRVGVRAADSIAFLMLADQTSAIEVFAYFVKESLRGGALQYSLSVPFRYGYDLEPGDIVELTPRWESSAVKCRLVRTSFLFDSPSVNLELEEVL